MILDLYNEKLLRLIPNVVHAFDGESSLLDKLMPWLKARATFIDDNFLGQEFEMLSRIYAISEKIVVSLAFADAIPSLDLSVTPAGFAVIATEGRAPASKERIERLIASLRSSAEAHMPVLLRLLLKTRSWRNSDIGRWWLATCAPSLDICITMRKPGEYTPLLDIYRKTRVSSLAFELEAEEIFGRLFLEHIRSSYNPDCTDPESQIAEMLRDAAIVFAKRRSVEGNCPSDHTVWHLCRPVIARLAYFPDLVELYRQSRDKMSSDLICTPQPPMVKCRGGLIL